MVKKYAEKEKYNIVIGIIIGLMGWITLALFLIAVGVI